MNLGRQRVDKKLGGGRLSEMSRYGRTQAYADAENLLQGHSKRAFHLVNHALTRADDIIDKSGSVDQLKEASEVFRSAYDNKRLAIREEWLEDVYELGDLLRKLEESGALSGKGIYNEVLKFWKVEIKNLERKGQILKQERIDELNTKIGATIAMQFMYFLTPGIEAGIKMKYSRVLGLAVKLADNITDLKDDMALGHMNISEEDIALHKLKIGYTENGSFTVEGNIAGYTLKEVERARGLFSESDKIVEEIEISTRDKEGLEIMKRIAKSWLTQAEELLI